MLLIPAIFNLYNGIPDNLSDLRWSPHGSETMCGRTVWALKQALASGEAKGWLGNA